MLKEKVKKEITFICTDKVERQCAEPIAREAEKRGYKVKFTDNKFEKCEIGFYCSHVNFPKNSKFSVVMLHDLGQQHGFWPNMWQNEFWSDFDIGLLPNKEWADMWRAASEYSFVRPKKGCYFVGWAKADDINQKSFEVNCTKIINDYGIDVNKKTVLYAPSWEWDNRQLEIIEACKELNVNLIIKQFPWVPKDFPEQYRIVTEMEEKSKGFENVFVLERSLNIFDAIHISDIVVSEESSTLYEAMMLDKPVIAVTDWLVPDVVPPRKPDFPYDFAIHCEKRDLSKIIKSVIENEKYKEQIEIYRRNNFPYIGNSSRNILDVIDNVVFENKVSELRIKENSLVKTPTKYKKTIKARKKLLIKIYIKSKIVDKNIFLSKLYRVYKNIKTKLKNV